MASVLDIVAEARIAATKQWDRARRAAFGSKASADPELLAQLIEADIIPRLLVAHRMPSPMRRAAAAGGAAQISEADVAAFAAASLTDEVGPLLARVEALMATGIHVETIYLHLLAPAARRLGSLWDDDACDFVEVTMGMWRLQEILHAVSARIPGTAPAEGRARRALFAPAPGEQHGLGALMVEEFFRRAGWQTWSAPAVDEDELLSLAAARPFDIVGLTVSAERHLTGLARTITLLRRTAGNRDLIVLVGGRAFNELPTLATEVGADGTAADGQLAVTLAESLLTKRAVAGVTQNN